MPLHYRPEIMGVVPIRTAFVPHCSMPENQAQTIASELGLFLILPSLAVEDFIAALRSCNLVVAEAMHGAILADAYRIPWIGCSFASLLSEGKTNAFKWNDWMLSLSMRSDRIEVLPVPASRLHPRLGRALNHVMTRAYIHTLRRTLKEGRWMMSKDQHLISAQDRLCERVHELWQRQCNEQDGSRRS
jgi:succinoglycan biosynthesis protein ExoV